MDQDIPRAMPKKLWTITLPRFVCPHCEHTIDNLKFKGRLVSLRSKKGKDNR